MTPQLHDAVDAFSASAAIRLRYQFLKAKAVNAPLLAPVLPPPVIPGGQRWGYLPSRSARRDGHPLAHLMTMREEAAAQIDALLDFLDATEGDVDLHEEDAAEPTDFEIAEEARRYDLATDDDEPSLGWTESGSIGSDTDEELAIA